MRLSSIVWSFIALGGSIVGEDSVASSGISPIEKEIIEPVAQQVLASSLPLGVNLSTIKLQKGCSLTIAGLAERTQILVFDCIINYKGQLFSISPSRQSLPVPQVGKGYWSEVLTLTHMRLQKGKLSARCLYQFDSAGVNYLSWAASCPNVLPRSLSHIKQQFKNDQKNGRFSV
jgi:hypothetical protein